MIEPAFDSIVGANTTGSNGGKIILIILVMEKMKKVVQLTTYTNNFST